VDGRYPKVLKTAIRMIVSTIQLALQNHETVHVRILPGNHDDQSALAIGIALSMYFENQERVKVDDSPSRFWWKRFGKVFLGATHGDKAKMKDLPLVMANDRPQDWAASTHKKIYTGHIHHERTIEEGGVIVSSMRTPVAKDAYHSFEKYRAGRSVYSETFNINGSMAGTTQINI
jgi:DNA repair exonuclease SbcCD nuclease subunit